MKKQKNLVFACKKNKSDMHGENAQNEECKIGEKVESAKSCKNTIAKFAQTI